MRRLSRRSCAECRQRRRTTFGDSCSAFARASRELRLGRRFAPTYPRSELPSECEGCLAVAALSAGSEGGRPLVTLVLPSLTLRASFGWVGASRRRTPEASSPLNAKAVSP